MDDRDLEKASTQSGDIEEERGRVFAPINSTRRPSLAHSRRSSRTLSRTRSQNGYGVSDACSDQGDPEAAPPLEKDPYEVGWENGDADPWSPRSRLPVRKWIIVFIVSMGSFCV